MDEVSLSRLKTGEQGIIASIHVEHAYKRRLSELGLIPGARISVLHAAPSGSPVAYCIKDTVVALRPCDSCKIRITPNDTD